MRKNVTNINEFTDVLGQGHTADPIAKDSKRGADKSNDEAPRTFATKAGAIAAITDMLADMPHEKVANIFKGMTDETPHDKLKALNTRRIGGSVVDDTNAQTLDSTRISPTSAAYITKEDLEALFGSEDLSEEFREKTQTIFEAALHARLVSEVVRLEEEFDAYLEEAVAEHVGIMTTNIDKYLSYSIAEWMEENRIAIQSGLKAEVMEDFIHGLKSLFEENYVDLPDEKVDVVKELSAHIADLEHAYNNVVSENIDLKNTLEESAASVVFAEAASSLPLTQQEKLRTLAEGINYDSIEDFSNKINTIKETYFGSNLSTSRKPAYLLNEEIAYEDNSTVVSAPSGAMSHYVDAISKTVKK